MAAPRHKHIHYHVMSCSSKTIDIHCPFYTAMTGYRSASDRPLRHVAIPTFLWQNQFHCYLITNLIRSQSIWWDSKKCAETKHNIKTKKIQQTIVSMLSDHENHSFSDHVNRLRNKVLTTKATVQVVHDSCIHFFQHQRPGARCERTQIASTDKASFASSRHWSCMQKVQTFACTSKFDDSSESVPEPSLSVRRRYNIPNRTS